MLGALLRLRLLQLIRFLDELGWGRSLFLLLGMVYALYVLMQSNDIISVAVGSTVGLACLFNINKPYYAQNKYHYLDLGIKPRSWFLLETYLISALVIFPYLTAKNYWSVLILIAPLLGYFSPITFRFKAKKIQNPALKYLPLPWRMTFRAQHGFAFPLYLVFSGLCCFPAGVFLHFLLISSFIGQYFGFRFDLHSLKTNGKSFTDVWKADLTNVFKGSIIAFIIPWALFVIFNPGFWWFIPLLIFVHVLHLTALCFHKWAAYVPGEDFSAIDWIGILTLIGIALPVFLPVVILIIYRNYKRAKTNMAQWI